MNGESIVNGASTISIVDALVLVLLAISLIRGIVRGLSGELAGLISAAVALAAGWYGFLPLGEWVEAHTRLSGRPAYTFAFALAVIGGYIAMRILRLALRSILEFSFKGAVERGGGALAGLLHGAMVAAVMLLFLGLWPAEPLHRWVTEESVAGRFVNSRLRPWYDAMIEQHPDLPLPRTPKSSEGETPPRSEDMED
jgi:uncharacterized membrane protein required for colicin V production